MKIFYSWQSDSEPKTGRYLIKGALEKAVRELTTDLKLEESERLELDHDTKGLLGSPPIADSILQKIEACDVFVADVTLIGVTNASITSNQVEVKGLINSNVAIELGYALKSIGDDGLLLVMNTEYGLAENLPFDLRHRRWPLKYSLLACANKKQRDESKLELSNQFKLILRAYLETKVTQINRAPFPTAPTTVSPAHYFDPEEELVPANHQRRWPPLRCSQPALLYVRIHPKWAIEPLPESRIGDLVWESGVGPMNRRAGSGTSPDRNRFGGIVYSQSTDSKDVLSATQLFSTREIWG